MTYLPRLASLIFNRVHWIEPGAADIILRVLDGRIGDMGDLRASRFEGEHVRRNGRWAGYSITPRGTAIVPIVGEFVNRGAYLGADSGLVSYEGVREQLKNAANDPGVRALVLDIDSPGGMVAGCAETAGMVREISQRKPVIAVANSDTCSAAYAIASGANMIVATESARVGSIGVLYVHQDHSRALDKKGVAVTIFQAGKHKTDGHPFGPISEDVGREIQANIDAHYQAFVNLVVAGRPQLSEQQVRDTEARVYRGSEAVEKGLADRVGTFDQAVALAESGQVATRPQAKSGVPASPPPQKVAAITGAKKMNEPNAAAPPSGWEGMTLADINQAVAMLRGTLGFSEQVAAKVEGTAPSEPAAQLQAQPLKPAETIPEAVARGRAEEKLRVQGILGLAESKDRPIAALALAIETDIPVDKASAVLAKVPKEAQTAANGLDRAAQFYAAVGANGGTPKVKHDGGGEKAGGTGYVSGLSAAADKLIAKQPAPTKLPLRSA